MTRISIKRAAASIAAAAAVLVTAGAASAEGVYFRIGGGYDWSTPAVFTDRDCNAVNPAALFGCGTGGDGLPIGAYGDFGQSPAYEIAVGFRAAPAIRVEAALSVRPGFHFSGNANFANTPDPQPVDADLMQSSVMGWAYVDLGQAAGMSWPVEPFIGFGVGVSRNVLSEMYYDFPGLTQPAWSETPGGTRISPAFGVAAGISRDLTDRLAVELAWRHVNYGVVGTDAGEMALVRRGVLFSIDIDETWTMLSTNAVLLSLRFGLGG